jgi:hypothetical protein
MKLLSFKIKRTRAEGSLITAPLSFRTGRAGVVEGISPEVFQELRHVCRIYIGVAVNVTRAGEVITAGIIELISAKVIEERCDIRSINIAITVKIHFTVAGISTVIAC